MTSLPDIRARLRTIIHEQAVLDEEIRVLMHQAKKWDPATEVECRHLLQLEIEFKLATSKAMEKEIEYLRYKELRLEVLYAKKNLRSNQGDPSGGNPAASSTHYIYSCRQQEYRNIR